MALSVESIGTIAYSTTSSIDVAYPAVVSWGSVIHLLVFALEDSNTEASQNIGTPGSGSFGVAGSTTYTAPYAGSRFRNFSARADGTESGTVTVSLTNFTSPKVVAFMVSVAGDGTSYLAITSRRNAQWVADASISVAISSDPGIRKDDVVLAAAFSYDGTASAPTFSAQGLSATGVTFAAAVELADERSPLDNGSVGVSVTRHDVTSGLGTTIPVYTATVSTAVDGFLQFIRFRELVELTGRAAGSAVPERFPRRQLPRALYPAHFEPRMPDYDLEKRKVAARAVAPERTTRRRFPVQLQQVVAEVRRPPGIGLERLANAVHPDRFKPRHFLTRLQMAFAEPRQPLLENDPLIRFVARGTTIATAATAQAVPLPAGVVSGQLLVACVFHYTSNSSGLAGSVSLPGDWTPLGVVGPYDPFGLGAQYRGGFSFFAKEAGGSESNPTMTPGASTNYDPVILSYEKLVADYAWDLSSPVLANFAATTSVNAAFASNPGLQSRDRVVMMSQCYSGASWSAQALTAPSVSIGDVTERGAEWSYGHFVGDALVIAGTGPASGAPTITATLSSSNIGGVGLIRLRVVATASGAAALAAAELSGAASQVFSATGGGAQQPFEGSGTGFFTYQANGTAALAFEADGAASLGVAATGGGAMSPLSTPIAAAQNVSFGTLSLSTTAGTTSLAVDFPPIGSFKAGDGLFMAVVNKYPTNAPTTPTGWTLKSQPSGGAGASGADSGSVYVSLYQKDTVTGTETGSETVTVTGANVSIGVMFSIPREEFTTLSVAADGGADNTAGTSFSATIATDIGIIAGDLLVSIAGTNTDGRTYSAQAVSATGATIGSSNEERESVTGTGDDAAIVIATHRCTSGTSSAPAVVTMTASGSTGNQNAGAAVLLRIRAVPSIAQNTGNPTYTSTGAGAFSSQEADGSATRYELHTSTGGAEALPLEADGVGYAAVIHQSTGDAAVSPAEADGDGEETFSGSGDGEASPAAGSGSGNEVFSSTGAGAASPAAGTGSGTQAFSASGSADVSRCAADGVGALLFSSSGTGAVSPAAGSGTAVESFAGSGTGTTSPLEADGVGDYTALAIDGSGDATVQPVEGSGTCVYTPLAISGSGTGACAPLEADGVGDAAIILTATGGSACAPLAASGTCAQSFAGTGAAATNPVAGAGTGAEVFVSTGAGAASPAGVTGTAVYTPLAISGIGSAAMALAASGTGSNAYVFRADGSTMASPLGASASGQHVFSATGTAASATPQGTGTGAVVFAGIGVAAFSPLTGTGLAAESFTAAGAAATSPANCSGSGLFALAAVGGAAASSLAALGSGVQAFIAIGNVAVQSMQIDGTARLLYVGEGVAGLLALGASGTGFQASGVIIGTGGAALPIVQGVGTAFRVRRRNGQVTITITNRRPTARVQQTTGETDDE